jgi:superfamily II DNA/RNA helicase
VRKHLRDPKRHEVDPNAGAVTTMEHHVLTVGGFRDKVEAVVALVEANPRAIVFTRTREGAMELRDALGQAGITAVDLHGNLTQKVRERNLERFSTGRADAVVATDVAARGIHVDNVGMVIHFDPPSDAKAYLHRSGRTARAGESGAVVTIATPRQLDSIVSQQRDAGVTSRYHDIRTTQRPMHALVLAESGTTEVPARSSRGGRPQGNRPYRSGHGHHSGPRRSGYAGAKSGSTKTFGKPARTGGSTGGSTGGTRPSGKKARWTASDKANRDARR